MTRTNLILLAAIGSLSLLAGAFLFQFIGYAPCKMCLWQRWPHVAAIILGVLALSMGTPRALWGAFGALAVLGSAAIGFWQTGVERKWWVGPSSCTGSGNGLTGDLLSTDGAATVMCDQVTWQLLGLSMASWNVLASGALAILWLWSMRRPN